MAVSITTDTNTVKVTSTSTNKVTVVDNTNNTSVSVSQPTTRVIKVATAGPQGPAGAEGSTFPYSGSAVITGSLSQGIDTIASGGYSHAEGSSTISRGYGSHAEGFNTTSTGSWSHTEGVSTMAFGVGSHAEGFVTVALGDYQHVQGAYNITSSAKTAFIIGNGTSNSARSNLVFASGSQFEITFDFFKKMCVCGNFFMAKIFFKISKDFPELRADFSKIYKTFLEIILLQF